MNSRQRVTAALSHQEPDRTPIFEYVFLRPLADELLGRRYLGDEKNWSDAACEQGWKATVEQEARDRIDLALRLDHDMLYVPINHIEPFPLNPPKMISNHDLPDDPEGALEARNARELSGKIDELDERFYIYECLTKEMKERDVDLPIKAPTYHHGIWDDIELLLCLGLDPDIAREHFRIATLKSLSTINKCLEYGITLFGVGGDFAGKEPLISPAMYREFIVPEIRQLSDYVHRIGGWTVNASDGKLWPMIEAYLLETDVDGYIEIDQNAGMELAPLKKQFGDRITFFGNLDCGNVLSFETPANIYAQTIACLEDGKGNGGHLLTASNAITASVPMENYLAIQKAYRDYFSLAPLVLG